MDIFDQSCFQFFGDAPQIRLRDWGARSAGLASPELFWSSITFAVLLIFWLSIYFFGCSIDILEKEHIKDLIGGTGIKPGFIFIPFRIAESPKQDIEKGKIGIVVLMDAFGMVQRMTLRTLDEVA